MSNRIELSDNTVAIIEDGYTYISQRKFEGADLQNVVLTDASLAKLAPVTNLTVTDLALIHKALAVYSASLPDTDDVTYGVQDQIIAASGKVAKLHAAAVLKESK